MATILQPPVLQSNCWDEIYRPTASVALAIHESRQCFPANRHVLISLMFLWVTSYSKTNINFQTHKKLSLISKLMALWIQAKFLWNCLYLTMIKYSLCSKECCGCGMKCSRPAHYIKLVNPVIEMFSLSDFSLPTSTKKLLQTTHNRMDLPTSFVIFFFCLLVFKGILAMCQFKIVLSLYSLPLLGTNIISKSI